MNKKELNRKHRSGRTRARIRKLGAVRLCVHKTLNHTYAQIISPSGDKVLVSASTAEKDVRTAIKHGGNKEAAVTVGKMIAERAIAAGIEQVAFDRSGFKFHGRVKSLADAARKGGLEF